MKRRVSYFLRQDGQDATAQDWTRGWICNGKKAEYMGLWRLQRHCRSEDIADFQRVLSGSYMSHTNGK